MKGSLLLGLVLTSLISTNSFAIEINHGKLISHKEWTKGNITGSFKEVKNPLFASSKLAPTQAVNENFMYASNEIHSGAVQAIVNQAVDLSGYGFVNITNFTSTQQTYTITRMLSTQLPCQGSMCVTDILSNQDVVTLDPQGSAQIERSIDATQTFNKPGTASYWVETMIQVNGESSVFASGSAVGNITISDNSVKK